MAVTIAKLSTVSTLDSTKFSAGLAKMRTDIGAFSAISLGAFSRVGTMITNFGARALRALPAMVSTSLAAADALDELASQLGFNVTELANLQRVAGLAGIDIGMLETSIGKMNAVLGEAMGGNKTAIKSFEDLKLSFEDLARSKPEDAYFAILDALKQLPTVAQRSSASMEVFGKSGRAMLKIIGLGSAGIRGQLGDTQRLGIATSAGDLASMGRASDTLDDLKNNLKGFGDQLSIQLAPKIELLGQDFLGFSKQTNLAANAAKWFADSLQTTALALAGWYDLLSGFKLVGGLPVWTGQGNSQQALFQSFQRANNLSGAAAPAGGVPAAPAGPARRVPPGFFNPSGKGPRQRAMEASNIERADYLRSEVARVTDEVSRRRPTGNSLLQTGQPSAAQDRYLQEMIAELKEIAKNTKNGGAGN